MDHWEGPHLPPHTSNLANYHNYHISSETRKSFVRSTYQVELWPLWCLDRTTTFPNELLPPHTSVTSLSSWRREASTFQMYFHLSRTWTLSVCQTSAICKQSTLCKLWSAGGPRLLSRSCWCTSGFVLCLAVWACSERVSGYLRYFVLHSKFFPWILTLPWLSRCSAVRREALVFFWFKYGNVVSSSNWPWEWRQDQSRSWAGQTGMRIEECQTCNPGKQ